MFKWISLWHVSYGFRMGWIPVLSLLAVALAVGSNIALGGYPHVSDEASYLLQARLFSAGLRVGPEALYPELMDWALWQVEPSTSVFPIGWSLLLAPAAAMGLERWMNPLLVALLPIFGWLALRERLTEREARWAAVALAVMPGIAVLAGTQMAHTSVFVALTGALAVALRDRDGPLWRSLAGIALGYVVLARPFDAALFAAPLALVMVWCRPRMSWTLIPVLIAGVLVLVDNAFMTGDSLRFLSSDWLEQTRPGCNALGFGVEHGCDMTYGSFGHTPAKALLIAGLSLERMERLILGVPGGGLLMLWGLFVARRRVLWLVPALIIPVLGYALYWTPGAAYGARFYHPGMLLVAAGVGVALARVRILPIIFVLAVATGHILLWKDLDGYFCADPQLAEVVKGDEGTILLQQRGSRDSWHPIMRMSMICSPGIGYAPLMSHHDPTGEGLQILKMPKDESRYQELLDTHYGPIWVLDSVQNTREVHIFQVK